MCRRGKRRPVLRWPTAYSVPVFGLGVQLREQLPLYTFNEDMDDFYMQLLDTVGEGSGRGREVYVGE